METSPDARVSKRAAGMLGQLWQRLDPIEPIHLAELFLEIVDSEAPHPSYVTGPIAEELSEKKSKASDADLEELESHFRELDREGISKEDRGKLLFSTDSFLHQTIWRICGNEEIISILNNYHESIKRIRLATLELDNRLVPSRDEMFALYQALKLRDSQKREKRWRLTLPIFPIP